MIDKKVEDQICSIAAGIAMNYDLTMGDGVNVAMEMCNLSLEAAELNKSGSFEINLELENGGYIHAKGKITLKEGHLSHITDFVLTRCTIDEHIEHMLEAQRHGAKYRTTEQQLEALERLESCKVCNGTNQENHD